ncbi:tRNA-specific adenosine deaminase subunit TAD3 [Lachnellula suecica]|uniref:tRNA-specific adenosine deaminase subunit TAD3 n=1 Tax=Lachnellula suecica TaxID=602035 RepID=A0A8T9CFA0_9HELO|nr:tRNA-specific adenosine deaminase subunit TAD3 [Lachnellula suecica]
MTSNNENLRPAEQRSDLTTIPEIPGGTLEFLKTKLETTTRDKNITVYVTKVPNKLASEASNLIRSVLSTTEGAVDLQHLRRFAKCQDVPIHVRNAYAAVSTDKIAVLGGRVFLIVAPIAAVTQQKLVELLSPTLGSLSFFTINVPMLAPTSQEQASLWSTQYWPTVYKKSNPFGPHPSIISRSEEEMQGDVEKWMDLAAEVARQSKATGMGEAFGVVVVERVDGVARPVAVAGDARWLDWPKDSPGNVTAHATLRAIDMVAKQVRQSHQVGEEQAREALDGGLGIFRGEPELPIEREHFRTSMDKEGYLCHKLELYCTHEPCVMCSMAIVHSRFEKVVFEHRMNRTGGLCADGDLGHGMFWRKELNWQLLAWQWFRPAPAPAEIELNQLRISNVAKGSEKPARSISPSSDMNV